MSCAHAFGQTCHECDPANRREVLTFTADDVRALAARLHSAVCDGAPSSAAARFPPEVITRVEDDLRMAASLLALLATALESGDDEVH